MSSFTLASPAQRIGKLKGEILAHSIPVEVLGIAGLQRQQPKRSGKTVSMRRCRPYGALATNDNTKNRPVSVRSDGISSEQEDNINTVNAVARIKLIFFIRSNLVL